jgi:LysM repeat protein
MSHQRLWFCAALATSSALFVAACGDDPRLGTGTLPPIVTTTTSSTTTTVAGVAQQQFYVIKPGDTLSKIAHSFGVTKEMLMLANGISDANHIEIGQKIEIPPATVVVAQLPTPSSVTPSSAPPTTLAAPPASS